MSLFDSLVGGLGNFDADTRALFVRFVIRAGKSGNANEFIKSHLRRILDEDEAPAVKTVKATVQRGRP